jgi:hypothetical protein
MRYGARRNSQKLKAPATSPISQLMIDAVIPLQFLLRQTVESVEELRKANLARNRAKSDAVGAMFVLRSTYRGSLNRPCALPGHCGFTIDRRALSEHGDLNLAERRIRSAIVTLEQIGFLDRALTSCSRYEATEDGLRRKPIRFQFGLEYFPLFDAANKPAAAVHSSKPRLRRACTGEQLLRPTVS